MPAVTAAAGGSSQEPSRVRGRGEFHQVKGAAVHDGFCNKAHPNANV